MKYLRDYIQITKDIAIKLKSSKATASVQTDLTLVAHSQHGNLWMESGEMVSWGSPVMSFLNGCEYDKEATRIRPWEEVYRVSETVLSSENRSLFDLSESSETCHTTELSEALLSTFFTQYPNDPQEVAVLLYSYLNVGLLIMMC